MSRAAWLVMVVGLLFSGQLYAQGCGPGTSCDAGEAQADCQGKLAGADAKCKQSHPLVMASNTQCVKSTGSTDTVGIFDARTTCVYGPEAGTAAGSVYSNQSLGASYYNTSCANRNVTYPLADAALNVVPIGTCFGGCKVAGEVFSLSQPGGVMLYGMRNRYYTGESCAGQVDANAPIDARQEKTEETKPKPPECTALGGGQTACMKPDGNYCATASTGKTFCWTPTEEGAKVDNQDAQRKSPLDKPVNVPDVAIPNMDWQRREGHQAQACINNKCVTYNVTNFTSVTAGTAKNSTGNNAANGTGNTSGNGQSSDGKDGKDSATDSGNCDAAPMCTGDTLKCLQLKFTWKIQCYTEHNEITKGDGCEAGDVPVCAGKSCKAEKYSQLLQQWRARCDAQADRDKAVADRAAGAADAAADDEAGVISKLWEGGEGTSPQFNTTKVVLGNGGELLPTVEFFGHSWSPPPEFYQAIGFIRQLVIAGAMIYGFVILWRR